MKMAGADVVVRALEDEGIEFAFGIPGTHNLELYDSLSRSSRVRPILVTDEQSASFMADGVWRASGKLAAVSVVPGAGLTHALSGIAEAFLDNAGLLVLACGIRRENAKAFQLHDVDQLAIARAVTKTQFLVADARELYATIRRACQVARSAPAGPVMVEVPVDHYMSRHDIDVAPAPLPDRRAAVPSPPPEWREPASVASSSPVADGTEDVTPASSPVRPEDLSRACALLTSARRPLLYLGAGALSAAPDLAALAERLEAPVSTTISGKGVCPERHPLWLWCGFGACAPPFVRKIAAECDATLAIGCRFSEVGTGSWGLQPPGKLIHVDAAPMALNRNFPAELAIVADAGEFVSALLAALPARKSDPDLRRAITGGHAAVWKEWENAGENDRVAPPQLFPALQAALGPEAIYTTDSGNGTFLAMECLRLEKARSFLAPVDFSCMGYAVPAALGAALACPDRPVAALAGDGAFLMTGLELLTASQLRVPLMTLVLRDRELAQIAQFQHTVFNRKSCSRLPDYDLRALCRGVGVEHLPLDSNAEIEPVLQQARSITRAGRPVVVEVAIDYSRQTYFTRGVVRTSFSRLPWSDRLRFLARALERRWAR